MINNLFGTWLAKLPENNKMERIWVLAKTDFRKRYYGTNLGVLWAMINPLFRLAIYYVVFTLFFKVEIDNFALYIFSGLIVWMFFSETTKKSMTVLQSKRYIFENIRIDKLDLFTASILAIIFGFIFNFIVYITVSLFFPVSYSIHVLWFLPIFINLCILVFAISMILSVMHIYFKDINHLWDIIALLLFWSSPIFYGRDIIFQEYPIIGYINPLSGIISNTREVILYATNPNWSVFYYDYFFSITLFIIGLILFRSLSHKSIEAA